MGSATAMRALLMMGQAIPLAARRRVRATRSIGATCLGIEMGSDLAATDEASNNVVEGNLIGTNASGSTTLGNVGDGVVLENDTLDNMIGGTAGNTIADNGGSVTIGTESPANNPGIASGESVLTNSIVNNAGLELPLSARPTGRDPRPVLTAAVLSAQRNGNHGHAIEHAECFIHDPVLLQRGDQFRRRLPGRNLSRRNDGDDRRSLAPISTAVLAAQLDQTLITATATDATDDTSEFSQKSTVSGGSPLIVTTTADSGLGSLRSAINYANTQSGLQTSFDIPDN